MSQITKRALEQSLKNLLLKKPLTKITINDIAEPDGTALPPRFTAFSSFFMISCT